MMQRSSRRIAVTIAGRRSSSPLSSSSSSICLLWFVVSLSTLLALLASPCQAQSSTPRREIGEFVVHMSPFDSPLTNVQASQVRDIVEILLDEFLEQYDWASNFASAMNIHVATVSLTAVDQVEYVASNQTVSVSFGGLVYFQAGSIGVPSQDSLTALIVQGLIQQDGLLLPALQAEFPQLSGTTLGVLVTQAPSMAPSTTPVVVVTDDDDSSNNGVQAGATINSGGGDNVGAVAGSIVGGFGMVLLGVLFLLVSRRRKRGGVVSSLEEDHDLQLEQYEQHEQLDLEKDGGQDSMRQARSLDDTNDTLDDFAEEDDASPTKQPTPVTTTSTNNNNNNNNNNNPQQVLAPVVSPISCSREEAPPPAQPSRLGQMFAAAASLPQRMMLAPSTCSAQEVQPPERMPSDEDDYDMDDSFEMESAFSDFSSNVAIQPHIIPIKSMESFEQEHQQRRQHMVLKKDMMMSRQDIIPFWKRTQNPNDDKLHSNCALKPTDHSAATLAIITPPRPQSSSRRLGSCLTPKLFPMISWMRDPKKQQPAPNSGYISSDADDNNTYGSHLDEDNLWDPDDSSVGYAASDMSISDVFTPADSSSSSSTRMRDDKSRLLHHHPSFQRHNHNHNEAYQLQRLRTPPTTGDKFSSSRGSRPKVPKSPTMRKSGESIKGGSDLVLV